MTQFSVFDPNFGDRMMTPALVTSIIAPGNQWFVNETTGADTNAGNSAAYPFKTLAAAIAAATADNGDVIYLQGTAHVTATLVWNKSGVSLVGLRAASNNGRSRISSSGTAFSPLVSVTAQGCSFVGIGTFHGLSGSTGSQVCWADAGGRNYYKNCQFLGGGDASMAALAGMRSLTIGGNGEDLFEDCTIGLDTIQRITAANASLEVLSGASRIVMRRCLFQAYNGLAGNVHVLVQSGGLDRYLLLDGCIFHNFGGTAMDVAISNAGGSPGGNVIVTPSCISIGATKLATAGVYVGQLGTAGGGTTGLGVPAS